MTNQPDNQKGAPSEKGAKTDQERVNIYRCAGANDILLVREEEDKDGLKNPLKMDMNIPTTLKIPGFVSAMTTKYKRSRGTVQEKKSIGEFEISVKRDPSDLVFDSIYLSAKKVKMSFFQYKVLDGPGSALEYVRSNRDKILEELRQTLALAELLS